MLRFNKVYRPSGPCMKVQQDVQALWTLYEGSTGHTGPLDLVWRFNRAYRPSGLCIRIQSVAQTSEYFDGWFDLDLLSQGHHKYGKWCTLASSLIVINDKCVSLTVTEICLMENFDCWFDLDLISQGHHKYGKWCTLTSYLIVINHKSVSLTVAEI